MKIGFYASGIGWDFGDLREAWKLADQIGFDSAHIMDNEVGPEPWAPEKPVFETFTILPALAEATSRIRLGPLVTPSGRRHPALFAKMTSVLDVISGGRLILAMGPGDEDRHFLPWGMAFPEKASDRIAMLSEEIQVIRAMWTQEHASFTGRYYRLDDAVNLPKPVQKPGPPIWVGISTGRKLMPRLAAEQADGINVYVQDDNAAKEILDLVEGHCAEVGRDFGAMTRTRHMHVVFTREDLDLEALIQRQVRMPQVGRTADFFRHRYQTSIRLVAGPPERCAEELKRIAELGFDYPILQFMGPEDPIGGSPATTLTSLEIFANDVMPVLRA